MLNKKKILLLITLNILFINLYSQTISVELENSYINMGEWTTLTIVATGDIKSIKKSETADINLTQVGNNSSYSNINGKATRSYILEYRVQPLRVGEIKLPTFYIITSSGEQIAGEEKVLFVSKLQDTQELEHDVYDDFETDYVKLFIDLPKRNLYVGEAIPVKVVAYFLTNPQPGIVRVPYMKTGSFILDTGDGKSNSKTEVILEGEKWLPVEWNCFLTPLKSGDLDLQIIMDSYINIQTGNGGFFANITKEELTTTSKLQSVKILQLPLTNRPDDFSGAIGDFKLSSSISNNIVSLGDPLTLTMDLYGTGNFQRVNVPNANLDKNLWKIYPDSSVYNGTNNSNYKGVKSFQQIISPLKESITELPKFTLSYFNPITESYSTLETEDFNLQITPSNSPNQDKEIVIDNSEFKETKEIMRHKKKGNNVNIGIIKNDILSIILLSFSIILLITLIFYKIIVFMKNRKQKKEIIDPKLIKEIKTSENSDNYLEALICYKKIISQKVSRESNCKESSVTSVDLTNEVYKAFFIHLEEILYTKKSIDKSLYNELVKDIKMELSK